MPRRRRKSDRPPGRPPVHPWDLWLDGDEHLLRRERDFWCDPESLRRQLHKKAGDRGITVSVRSSQLGLLIQANHSTPRGARPRYDWDKLLDGQVHTLHLGTDVTAKPESFDAHARQIAHDRDMKLSIKRLGNTLLLQATHRLPF